MTRRRGPRSAGLSYVEAEVHGLLWGGLTRTEVARQRCTTAAAVTHVCHRIERKGYGVPPAFSNPQQAPAQARVRHLLAQGLGDHDIADTLGISYQRAGQLRRRVRQKDRHT